MVQGSYWAATRHPWSSLLFVLPLLALYEVGLYTLGSAAHDTARNGADVWVRAGVAALGIRSSFAAPALLLSILLLWGVRNRNGQPQDRAGVWVGMAIESAACALVLFGLSQALWFAASQLQQRLATPVAALPRSPGQPPDPALELLLSYVGAGIYEETLFRLLLFSGLVAVFTFVNFPKSVVLAVAAIASAIVFAVAHHLGPSGEPFHLYVCLFRCVAGVYFALLFHWRGFGIAVGAHAGYDVLVGLLLRT